jgi:serine/threonine-protein kinase RsbW
VRPQTIRGTIEIASRRDEVERAQSAVADTMIRAGYDDAACYAVRAALEEALANAIEHGNECDPAKKVRIEFEIGPRQLVEEVRDRGMGFDPDSVPDPTRPENVDIPSGRGIVLMRAFMTEVLFMTPGNRVRLTYRRPS